METTHCAFQGVRKVRAGTIRSRISSRFFPRIQQRNRTVDLAQLRKDYALASLDMSDVDADPIVQFHRWLDQAMAAQVPEPTAMSLATVSAEGDRKSVV